MGLAAWIKMNEWMNEYCCQSITQLLFICTRTWLRYIRVFAIANPSVVCLLPVTFMRPTLGLKLSAIFLRHIYFVPQRSFDLRVKFYGDCPRGTPLLGALNAIEDTLPMLPFGYLCGSWASCTTWKSRPIPQTGCTASYCICFAWEYFNVVLVSFQFSIQFSSVLWLFRVFEPPPDATSSFVQQHAINLPYV